MRLRILSLFLLVSVALPVASAQELRKAPKRVLILDSFGRNVSIFTVSIASFRSELSRRASGPVDFHEIALEASRIGWADDDRALAEFLSNRLAGSSLDLVVSFGAPATRFAVRNRDRLFSRTPLLITSTEQRNLPPGALTPMTAYVGEAYHLPEVVENILRLLPDTKTIAVAIGASRLEQFWRKEAQRELAFLSDRVRLRWLNELSFEEMKQEVAALPANSAVLYTIVHQDATGVTLEQDQALDGLRSATRAPFFSCYESELGSGIIGGRLFANRTVGIEAAAAAARILEGEPPSRCSRSPLGTKPPTYDWRELKRWGIGESRLPPGSTVLFRPPSFWRLYRWYVLGIVGIVVLQSSLIAVLLVQQRRRNRAERKFAQSERNLHMIADSLPVLIAYVDRAQRYVFANRAYEARIGVEVGGLRGRELREVLGNELYQVVRPYVERVLSGEPVTFAAEQKLPRGQRLAFEAIYVPDKDDWSAVRGFFGLVVDVTDRKLAEQEARQLKDELAHAARITTMGEMTAALAHELNQPLAAILSNAQAATRFLGAPDPDLEEVRDILHDIAADDTRAGEVIRRIRSLVKKAPADLRPLDLNAILKEVIRLLHSDAVIRGIVVLNELDPDLPEVRGDRIQLQQVVLNLLLNAFDAMRDGLASDRAVIVRSRQVDSEVLVTVSDRGSGILPDEMDRLFEPFRSSKPGGLGMGLSISRSIVASHGGRMWAENNATRGATFGFSLPVCVEAALSTCLT
ncbi:MAG: ATP-binding protein [Isosphaeraceae bacterium]